MMEKVLKGSHLDDVLIIIVFFKFLSVALYGFAP
jgi:hypothetical protein